MPSAQYDWEREVLPPRSQLSMLDKVNMFFALLPAPVLIIFSLLKSPFSAYGRSKSWRRIAFDRLALRVMSAMNRRQTRAFFGSTAKTYANFIRHLGGRAVVEEVQGIGADGARLFWIEDDEELDGKKRMRERVLLYLHGGAFVFGPVASAPAFWFYMQEELRKRGKPTSTAILDYTLVPDRKFPTQLTQSILAIQQIINSGVHPKNIQLVGDSAGGALIHQILAHMLHPVPYVQTFDPDNLPTPLGSAYLMSPWVRLRDTPDMVLKTPREGRGDFLTRYTGLYWADTVLEGVRDGDMGYLDANSAEEGWFEGVEECVGRVLVSAGNEEVLRDEIVRYGKWVGRSFSRGRDGRGVGDGDGRVKVVVQENGLHVDPFFDFAVGERDDKEGGLTRVILEWLDEGFE